VLVKAKKLYPWDLQAIRGRIYFARKAVEARCFEQKLQASLSLSREEYLVEAARIDSQCQREIADLDASWLAVQAANEPKVLAEEGAQKIIELASRTVETPEGEILPLVLPEEMHSLTIRRGTFDEAERKEIESHVTHSYNFLIQIPWTQDLHGIPEIAYGHHEKLNGAGYPRRLKGDEIPIQAKMMTIADIFDALTAQDRPYKPAIPVTEALKILGYEAKDGGIDPDLLDLFIQKQIFRLVIPGERKQREG
jgi:hypothetical protein